MSGEAVESLGAKIKRLRLQMGMTQQQVAGADLTRALICMVERGKSRPSAKTLGLIAERLNQPLSAFLDLAPTPVEQDIVETLLTCAAMLIEANRVEPAISTLRQAYQLSADRNFTDGQFRALEQLGGILRSAGRYDEAMDALDRFLDLARALHLPARTVQGFLHIADTVYAQHQFLVARRYYERALRETDERKSVMDLRQKALTRKGNCLVRIGEYEEAAIAYEEAVDLHDYLGDDRELAHACMGLGVAYRRLRKLARAREVTHRSLTLMQRLGDRNRILVLHNLATIEGDLGHWEAALYKFETCREAYRAFGWAASEASLLEELALYWKAQSDLGQAAVCCRDALRLLDKQDEPILRGRLLKLHGEILLANGSSERAQELLEASACLLRYFGDRQLLAEVRSSLGEAAAQSGPNR